MEVEILLIVVLCIVKLMKMVIGFMEPVIGLRHKEYQLITFTTIVVVLMRVDWIKCQNKLYFNEMTFTPFSGFFSFKNKDIDKYLGSLLKIEVNKN